MFYWNRNGGFEHVDNKRPHIRPSPQCCTFSSSSWVGGSSSSSRSSLTSNSTMLQKLPGLSLQVANQKFCLIILPKQPPMEVLPWLRCSSIGLRYPRRRRRQRIIPLQPRSGFTFCSLSARCSSSTSRDLLEPPTSARSGDPPPMQSSPTPHLALHHHSPPPPRVQPTACARLNGGFSPLC